MSTLELVASKNVSRIDLPKFKIEYYLNMFKQLTSTLTGFVYSPQFIILMMIYFRLADPTTAGNTPIAYEDFKDFLKKTRNIMNELFYLIVYFIHPFFLNFSILSIFFVLFFSFSFCFLFFNYLIFNYFIFCS